MQRSILRRAAAASLALLFTAFSWAAFDGPKDHANPARILDDPLATQFPSARPMSPADLALTPIRASDVAQAVRDFVGEEARMRGGLCRITDPVERATLDLKLKQVPIQSLAKVRPDTYVTCATFVGSDGTPYDVDFYVTGTTRFNLKVVDATIHAKNGLQRYAWAEEKGLRRVKALSSEMPMREELAH